MTSISQSATSSLQDRSERGQPPPNSRANSMDQKAPRNFPSHAILPPIWTSNSATPHSNAAETLAQIEASVNGHDATPSSVNDALALQLHYRGYQAYDSDSESSGARSSDFSPIESPLMGPEASQPLQGFPDMFSKMDFHRQRSRSIGDSSDTSSVESSWSLPVTGSMMSPATSVPEFQASAMRIGDSSDASSTNSDFDHFMGGQTLVDMDPTPQAPSYWKNPAQMDFSRSVGSHMDRPSFFHSSVNPNMIGPGMQIPSMQEAPLPSPLDGYTATASGPRHWHGLPQFGYYDPTYDSRPVFTHYEYADQQSIGTSEPELPQTRSARAAEHEERRRSSYPPSQPATRTHTTGRRATMNVAAEPLHWNSQTTSATKQAAIARRKPGAEAKFACPFCNETFTRAYNLRGHIRAHNGERPYACTFPGCGKAFARAHDLKRHNDLHSNVVKFRCETCQRPFRRHEALLRHYKQEAETCGAQIDDFNPHCSDETHDHTTNMQKIDLDAEWSSNSGV